jgi:adenosylmethionine-8-amino-7-oxononanoate aminotransferase
VSSVFPRGAELQAVRAEGCWIEDRDGNRYLDAAGGAVVCGVGHGRAEVIDAIAGQLRRVDYVHAASFTTQVMEDYAAALATRVPVLDARVYPVAGGSEAMETALKLARAYHLARGEGHRIGILARTGSYHGNTLGALDVSGRVPLRAPYLPWLGRAGHLPAVYEYRCPALDHPQGCGRWHADRLEEEIINRGDVAAFVAEAVGGATLGACVPPGDYWEAVAAVCRRHGVLLVVDEVMSGFGRTGALFALEHWGVTADIVVAGKGASSGYWPLGLCVASGEVFESVGDSFVHGFTFSHHPVGAAAGLAALRILEEEGLVGRAATAGLVGRLGTALGDHPHVGDIRGRGLLAAVEFVADRSTREPFPRELGVTERLVAAAWDRGVVVYPVARGADGVRGDALLLGPPLVIGDAEMDLLIERITAAVASVWP